MDYRDDTSETEKDQANNDVNIIYIYISNVIFVTQVKEIQKIKRLKKRKYSRVESEQRKSNQG